MVDFSAGQLLTVFLFLLVPFICGIILKRFRISPIIGYSIGGLVLANIPFLSFSASTMQPIASYGILLLLFLYGVELNLDRLWASRKVIIAGGILQWCLTAALSFCSALLFKFTPLQAFFIGAAFTSSSTVLIRKLIQDRAEETTFIGSLGIGLLMFQNLAFIPVLIICSYLRSAEIAPEVILKDIFFAAVQTLGIMVWLYVAGKKIFPYVFRKVAPVSRDLLNIVIILAAIITVYLSFLASIPLLVGVFVAGVVVSQTLEHLSMFAEVRTVRDILGMMMFAYIASYLTFGTILQLIPQILLFTLVIMAVKILVLFLLFLYLRLHSRPAFQLSLYLFELGEAAFIILTIAYTNRLVTQEQYLSLIMSVMLTILVTPLLSSRKEFLYIYIRRFIIKYIPALGMFMRHRVDHSYLSLEHSKREEHIIICGYGRVGSYIGRALMLADLPFAALDYNLQIIASARQEGVDILYGDPTDPEILTPLQADRAVAMVLCLPDTYTQEQVVINVKKLNQRILVLANVNRREDVQRMKDLGADVVIQSEYEASLSLIKKLFMVKDLSKQDIINKVRHFKIEQGIGG